MCVCVYVCAVERIGRKDEEIEKYEGRGGSKIYSRSVFYFLKVNLGKLDIRDIKEISHVFSCFEAHKFPVIYVILMGIPSMLNRGVSLL